MPCLFVLISPAARQRVDLIDQTHSATMKYTTTVAAALVGSAYAHGHHADQTPIEGPLQGLWYNTLPGDGGTQVSLRCLGKFGLSLT